jgi:hypothetical protein
MMRRLRVVGLSLAFLSLAMLVVSAQAGTAKPQSGKVKHTARPVLALAMDGPRVAYMRTDGRVGVWNVVTGATSVIKGNYPSRGRSFGHESGEVAIAGKRVALITRFAIGNTEQTQERLYTAPLGGTARQLGKLTNHTSVAGSCDGPVPVPGGADGDWLGGLVGSGKILAVSRWKADGSSPTETTNERLNLIEPTKLRTIASGPGAIVSQSTNSGHIAVLRSTEAWGDVYDGSLRQSTPMVGIYSTSGALLGEVALAPLPSDSCLGQPLGVVRIALSGNRLVVLRVEFPQAGPRTTTVDVYDWTTGALVHIWPLAIPPTADGLSVSGRIAVIEGNLRLRLLDLTTGKTTKIAGVNPGTIGSRGLVYAVNSYPGKQPGHGKLVFVPTAKLLAALSK